MYERFVVTAFVQLYGWRKRYRVLDSRGILAPDENGVYANKREAEEVCVKLNTEYEKRL